MTDRVDVHLHLVDFLQRARPGMRLLERLDAADITHAVVFGLPVRKKWSVTEPVAPEYYLDDNAPATTSASPTNSSPPF